MGVTSAGLEETGELAIGVWLNPSQVRHYPAEYLSITTAQNQNDSTTPLEPRVGKR